MQRYRQARHQYNFAPRRRSAVVAAGYTRTAILIAVDRRAETYALIPGPTFRETKDLAAEYSGPSNNDHDVKIDMPGAVARRPRSFPAFSGSLAVQQSDVTASQFIGEHRRNRKSVEPAGTFFVTWPATTARRIDLLRTFQWIRRTITLVNVAQTA